MPMTPGYHRLKVSRTFEPHSFPKFVEIVTPLVTPVPFWGHQISPCKYSAGLDRGLSSSVGQLDRGQTLDRSCFVTFCNCFVFLTESEVPLAKSGSLRPGPPCFTLDLAVPLHYVRKCYGYFRERLNMAWTPLFCNGSISVCDGLRRKRA